MYLYIIGFQLGGGTKIRTLLTDYEDTDTLILYYRDLLSLSAVKVERVVIEDSMGEACKQRFVNNLETSKYDFNKKLEEYYAFESTDTNVIVESLLGLCLQISELCTSERSISANITKLVGQFGGGKSTRKDSKPVRALDMGGIDTPASTIDNSLDSFYHPFEHESKYLVPTGILATQPHNSIYSDYAPFEIEKEEVQNEKTDEQFGDILVIENKLTGNVLYKLDTSGWKHTLRETGANKIFPEVFVYAVHQYRKLPHITALITAYLDFKKNTETAIVPVGGYDPTPLKDTYTMAINKSPFVQLTSSSDDIFIELERIVGIDNLIRDCKEGQAFGVRQKSNMSKLAEREREILPRYMALLNKTMLDRECTGLIEDVILSFLGDYVVSLPDNQITITGFLAVVVEWIKKHIATTAFGRLSGLLVQVTSVHISKILPTILQKKQIATDGVCVSGVAFSRQLAELMTGGFESPIQIKDSSVVSAHCEFSALVRANSQIPPELSELLYTEVIKRFFEDVTEYKENASVQSRDLWGAFTRYVQYLGAGNILLRFGQTEFSPLCKSLGFEVKRSAAGMMWKNMVLKELFSSKSDAEPAVPVGHGTISIAALSIPTEGEHELVQTAEQYLAVLAGKNFAQTSHFLGIQTQGSSNKKQNLQLRADPVIPHVSVSPWTTSTIEDT